MGHRHILLADDHVIIRRGLKLVLDQHFRTEHLIEASCTHSILSALSAHPITHIILDLQLLDANAMEILPHIKEKYPEIPILIYTMSPEDIYGARLMQFGVLGFLSKQSEESEVVRALDLFFRGKEYISPNLKDRLNDTRSNHMNPLLILSEREMNIMNRILKGESVKEISAQLNLKKTTVATYKARIFDKTGAENILDLRNIAELYGSVKS